MTVTGASAEGYFKEIYADKLEELIPEFSVLSEEVPFEERERLGDTYNFPIRTKRSHGWTMASGATSETAFQLNAVVSGEMKNASLAGSMFVHREAMAYKAVLKATEKGKAAFGDLFDDTVEDVINTASFMRELCMLYGGTDIGVLETDGAASATQSFTLTAASSALGLWAQMEGAKIDIRSANLATLRNATEDVTVNSVDIDSSNRVVINVTGDATELDNVIATDRIVPKGFYGNWFPGLDAITTNSGELFGINATTYPIWRANALALTGSPALAMAHITKAAAPIVMRAGMRPLKCFIGTLVWADLNNDVAALRQFVDSQKAGVELGTQKITYYGPNGIIEIVPHPMIKTGEAFLGDTKKMKRVGTTDLTFNLGVEGQNSRFLRELENNAGFEFRCLWDQATVITQPRAWTKITGIRASVS
jgi:hypothetical protein